MGFNADASKFALEKHLTSAIWNWGPYYAAAVKQVRDGTWKRAQMNGGPLALALWACRPLGRWSRTRLKTSLSSVNRILMAGRFDVFWGHQRSVRKAAHRRWRPADEVLLGMNWFVEGVVGTVPKWATGAYGRTADTGTFSPFMTLIMCEASGSLSFREEAVDKQRILTVSKKGNPMLIKRAAILNLEITAKTLYLDRRRFLQTHRWRGPHHRRRVLCRDCPD